MIDGEEKLIQMAIEGESSAFGALYDHYQPMIYRFVLLRISHREEAEDLTHQVFIRALENITTYEHKGFPFSSWLYRIARNSIIDHYRTKKSEMGLEELPESAYVDESLDVSGAIDVSIKIEQVERAMRKLKPDYQEVIILRFIEELSVRETAEALEKTEGALKVFQHRAMKELKEVLSEETKSKSGSNK